MDVKTGEVQEVDLPAKDSPIIQAQAKPIVDEHHVMNVFYFADEVIKYLFAKIHGLHITNGSTGSPINPAPGEP